jgi:TonB family protein
MHVLIAQSVYVRTGFLVLASHMLILFSIVSFGQGAIEKSSNIILSGEIIERESTVSSKTVARRSSAEERVSKSSATIKHESPDGLEQQNSAQTLPAFAAPISMPSVDSAVLNNPKPPYPISSRENGEQGRVYLNACVNEHGKIDRLDLAKSSGHFSLDRSALNTVRHWEFIPAYQNGKPVSMCYRLPIHFVLSSQRNLF